MGIVLVKQKELPYIPEAFSAIIGIGPIEVFRFTDDAVDGDEVKVYNTYKIVTESGIFVLKRSADEEDNIAERTHYGLLAGLPVPRLYGAAEGHLLLEFVPGEDLLSATDEGVAAAARSLTAVMNAFPMGRGYDTGRYEIYLKRLGKRMTRLEKEPELKAAFEVFLKRQKEIPLTLSNADLLPLNVLFDGEKSTIIDWEFGGFLPYSLDIARFVAHGRTEGNASPFRMTEEQKKLFVELVYEGFETRPPREIYERDLLLALFNEHVEILEWYLADESRERGETFFDYYSKAGQLAKAILKG